MANMIVFLFAFLLLGCSRGEAGTSPCKAFEDSTTKANFKIVEHLGYANFNCPKNACRTRYSREHNISVTKTATNALAAWSVATAGKPDSYMPEYEHLEAELDAGAWQDFIRTLCSLSNGLKKEHSGSGETKHNDKEWVTDIYSYDNGNFYKFKSAASSFDGFEKALDDFKKDSDYRKSKKVLDGFKERPKAKEVEVALAKASIRYDRGGYRVKVTDKELAVDIYSSDKDSPEQFKSAVPNFEVFKKALDGIKAKIKEKMLLRKSEAENKLSAEYQRRFGKPITDAELSTTWIEFKELSGIDDEYSKDYHIRVTRDLTEMTAKAEILPTGNNLGNNLVHKAELGMGEWLDFVHALHKCGDKWLRIYFPPGEWYSFWRFKTIYSYIDEGAEEPFKYKRVDSEGYDVHPKNWAEFMKIMDGMEERIKKKAERQR
jgi:hypothetical protein